IIGALFIASNITGPIIASKEFAYKISHGNLDGQLDFENRQDELGELGQSLNTMASQLSLMDWQKQGKEGLDDALRGEWSEDELSGRFLRLVIEHLEAQMGGIYLTSRDDPDQVELIASHAFIDRQGNFTRIKRGEGIIGQALNESSPIFYTNPKEDVPSLNYGVAERIPPFFAVSPLIYETKALGVFFVASMKPFEDRDRAFLTENLGNVAMKFNTTRSRGVIDSLLKNAQEQHEELRVINEELEEQTRALKESEEELQTQQEELKVTNEELEERTQALENQTASISNKNRELTQAQKEIEKKAKDLEMASKYKSEFLANMSHELRTPLNSILILSQLMEQNKGSNLSEKQIESAAAIHSSGSDLLKLINEILDLTKVEAGKIDLHLEDMNFSGMISDLQRVFKGLAEERKINFSVNQDSPLPQSIYTDSHRIQQVLRNLLTNAFKFTGEQGSVTLIIEKPEENEAKAIGVKAEELIALRVRDSGIGIPENKQAAIFEAFQQADGSTSRKYGGTGLGLSISRELSKVLGGNLTLESTPGKGSTFTLLTPRVCHPAGESLPTVKGTDQSMIMNGQSDQLVSPEIQDRTILDSIEVRDDRSSVQPGEKSILIIEDDPRFSKILKEFAQERGYKCLLAEDGETGLHFADYYKPRGIILDIGLPGIDGWTVMERLKANSELRHIPVHFMSGSESVMDAMKMGAVGFVTKPVSLEKIEEAFTRIESLTFQSVRRLLVVEDDLIQRESIKDLIGDGDVETITVATGAEAYSELESSPFDCMILDLGLEDDMSGYDLLEKIRADHKLGYIPIIIYTGRDLSQKEEAKLRQYSESIIIKGVKSPERLLDETALFLHRVELELPQDKQRMLNINHDKNSIFKEKKILLVDDDMRNVFALTSVLEEKGMIVDVAKNGAESLEKISKETNLVLMDIMMPVMDGYEAMRKLRKNQSFKKIPIIALTAKAMKGDRNKSIEAGASDYLAKPIDTEKLLSMLRVWLYDQ
uniref:response regulator n=1 Tax=Oceanispirochaeta sp. TaxID=2035350 RepID=UPI00262AA7AE